METVSPGTVDAQAELGRRHKTAVLTFGAMLMLTLAFSLISFFGKNLFRHQNISSLDIPFKIVILLLGIGSIVLRRARFSAMRLKDIAVLKGASGLLRTLWSTALLVTLLGAAISSFGFALTVWTGDPYYSYRAGAVGLLVLLYHYPTRAFWQRALQRFVTLGPESQKPSTPQPPA